MRVLHVSCQKPDSTGSGVYLSALVRSLAAVGHENAVVCGVAVGDAPERSLESGTKVRPVRFGTPELPFDVCGMSDVMPYPSTRWRDVDGAMAAQLERAFVRAVAEVDAEFNPDLVICHHLYFVTALVRETLPHRRILAVCHSTDLRQLRQHGFMADRIRNGVARLDAVAALTEEQKHEIAELFPLDPRLVHVVGTGYDSHRFRTADRTPEAQRRLAWGIIGDAAGCASASPDASAIPVTSATPAALAWDSVPDCPMVSSACGPLVLYVGKIGFKKGVPSLVRAFAQVRRQHPDAKLVLVGGHSDEAEYRAIRQLARGQEADGAVFLTGALDPGRLAELYRAARVFVLPSFFEGLPLVIAEALACGARVVATDLPGVRSFYRHFLPDAPLDFVAPPPLANVDTPDPADLPAFESALAEAIVASLSAPPHQVDARGLDWEFVAKRILSVFDDE